MPTVFLFMFAVILGYFWAAMTATTCQFGATLWEKSHLLSNGVTYN